MPVNPYYFVFRNLGNIPNHILEDESITILIKREYFVNSNRYVFTRLHCKEFHTSFCTLEPTLEIDYVIAFTNLTDEDRVFLTLAGVRLKQVSHIPIQDIILLRYNETLRGPVETFGYNLEP